jgi:hypothetical protein
MDYNYNSKVILPANNGQSRIWGFLLFIVLLYVFVPKTIINVDTCEYNRVYADLSQVKFHIEKELGIVRTQLNNDYTQHATNLDKVKFELDESIKKINSLEKEIDNLDRRVSRYDAALMLLSLRSS